MLGIALYVQYRRIDWPSSPSLAANALLAVVEAVNATVVSLLNSNFYMVHLRLTIASPYLGNPDDSPLLCDAQWFSRLWLDPVPPDHNRRLIFNASGQ